MRLGRNDPCPCGSGKKYKKCCLGEHESQRPAARLPDAKAEGSARLRETVFAALLRFARSPEYERSLARARALFRGGRPELPSELAEDEQVKFLFFSVLDQPQHDGRTIAERFLAEGAGALTDRQQRLLRRMAAARLRPYEVEDVQVDRGVRVRDLWSGEPFFVTERAGTHQMTRWDVLGARIAPEEDGTTRFEGGIYLLPTRLKHPLLEALRAEERRLRRRDPDLDEEKLFRQGAPLFHAVWLDHVVFPPRPMMVTAERDPVEFGTVVYDVVDAAALQGVLDGRADLERDEGGGYTWFEEAQEEFGPAGRAAIRPEGGLGLISASPDGFRRSLGRITLAEGRLTLEVTSRARAERGRRLLADATGPALRHRSTRFDSVEKAIERHRSPRRAESADPVPPEVAAEFLREFKERHYRTWLDEPLPALDGRTPRHAASLKTQRGRVIDLLKEMENHEARSDASGSTGYDFGWMWTELGLERPT